MNESRNTPQPTADTIPEGELRALTTLLRGLPDPEPPSDIVERVMARVAEREARPKLIRLIFSQPAVGTAMAAGLAGLLVLSASFAGLLPLGAPESSHPAPLTPSEARIIAYGTAPDTSARRAHPSVTLPLPSTAVTDPQAVIFFQRPAPQAPLGGLQAPAPSPVTSPLDRRLDHQLNQLLLHPRAFYQRLNRVRKSEHFVARLAERAARRGDAAEVALRLRQQLPEHQRTEELVESLLWAALSASAATQEGGLSK